MSPAAPRRISVLLPALALLALVAGVLWLRWPGLGFNVWNVDEAIHAAVARSILDGGLPYRDAVDQRTPLSYYAVAAVFAIAGENNLWAVRAGIAGLIAATAWLLLLAGRRLRGTGAGLGAALLYATLASVLLYPGDANAANTEWFVAFFTAAAAVAFLGGNGPVRARRCFLTGVALAAAGLAKQPAVLELAAPVAALAWLALRGGISRRELGTRLLALAAGWALPVALTLAYFAAHGALGDFAYYAWTYNVRVYGPEVAAADRVGAALLPARLLLATSPALLAAWLAGAAVAAHRLLQRTPTPTEQAKGVGDVYLAAWSIAALAGAASSGRSFDHYVIQFLPALALGAGLVLARMARARPRGTVARIILWGLLLVVVAQLGAAALRARRQVLPADPSVRVAGYIRSHSAPTDPIFVWGYHPDIYLHADRRAASRFVYCSFLSGLVPWTNVAPGRDTAYAIIPGARATLLRDLAARPPRFIVDCSAGPNRHWDKYPLESFPELRDYVLANYEVVEGGQFVPQGFRLYERRFPGAGAGTPPAVKAVPPEVVAGLALGVAGPPLVPLEVTAPNGAGFSIVDGRAEYFAHAPSRLRYRVPVGVTTLRGGFGLRALAYGPDNHAPTDGAEFIVRWQPAGGTEVVLLRRWLRPREEPADRGVQSFRVRLPSAGGGELTLAIGPGPADSAASDWTFWTDLLLETSL